MSSNLSDYTSGRDNNFNLIRLAAALLVLISHSFTLSTGKPEMEPFVREIGFTLGTIAVDIFFVTSGFLVTGSLLARRNIVQFAAARMLRIYPALIVSQVITVIVVGLWFTSLAAGEFFRHRETAAFLLKNSTLIRYVIFTLPGAFESVPYGHGVNSSLWTLPIEMWMYIKLGLMWCATLIASRYSRHVFATVCVGVAVFAYAMDMGAYFFNDIPLFAGEEGWALTCHFFTGASLRLLARRVPASGLASVMMALALAGGALIDQRVFGGVYKTVVAYLVVYVALVPRLAVPPVVARGDYSYGLYIYAYPIQQATASLWPGILPYQMFAVSFVVTFAFAIFSWHVVEERALKLKQLAMPHGLKPALIGVGARMFRRFRS